VTLAYSDTWVKRVIGYTPASSATNGEWTQADFTDAITDGYADVTMRTGTASGTTVDLAVKTYVIASWRDAERNRIAKGGSQLSGVINANFPAIETVWTQYYSIIKAINEHRRLTFGDGASGDYSEVMF
jgi:hypothetical protein